MYTDNKLTIRLQSYDSKKQVQLANDADA
jgi:hypothetical protein